MRLLAVTDIHGAYNRVLGILAEESPVDAIVVGGDLTTGGTAEEAEEALRSFARTGCPVLAVAGNMDPPPVERAFERMGISLNGHGVVINGVGLFGVSAAPLSPLNTPNEIEEEEIARRAEAGWTEVRQARWKIFVPHAPPRDTRLDRLASGRHVGSTAVRRFVDNRQPDLLLCGHIHEARGTDRLGTTRLVNCGPAGAGYYVLVTAGESLQVALLP